MRKINKNIIEVKKEVTIGDIILEIGDKIQVLSEKNIIFNVGDVAFNIKDAWREKDSDVVIEETIINGIIYLVWANADRDSDDDEGDAWLVVTLGDDNISLRLNPDNIREMEKIFNAVEIAGPDIENLYNGEIGRDFGIGSTFTG